MLNLTFSLQFIRISIKTLAGEKKQTCLLGFLSLFQSMIQLGVTSMTKKPIIGISWWITHTLTWNNWCLVSQASLVQRPAFLQSNIRIIAENCFLDPDVETPRDNCLLSELACYLWNSYVFVFIRTIWLSNAGGENPPYALQHHSKYSHTLW